MSCEPVREPTPSSTSAPLFFGSRWSSAARTAADGAPVCDHCQGAGGRWWQERRESPARWSDGHSKYPITAEVTVATWAWCPVCGGTGHP